MADILNMDNLREIIDHDKVLERELISNFHTCYHICISELGEAITNQDDVLWRNAAHALKGIAFNLGAESLGELSLQAEHASDIPYPQKVQMLEELKKSYAAVCQELKQQELKQAAAS